MFDRIRILIEDSACLNQRHRQAGCALCVQACPSHAIQVPDTAPVLDAERCVGCGACLPACPTGVFSQHILPEEMLLQAAARTANDERLAVACPVHPDPAGSRTPADRVFRHSRCLASMAVDYLLALSRDGRRDVWLDDSPCEVCPIGQAHGLVLASVQAGNTLLQACDRPARIRTVTQDGGLLRPGTARRPVTQAVPQSLARRDVFAMFKRLAERSVDQPAARLQPARQRLPQRVPLARQRLLHHIQVWNPAPNTTFPVDRTPFAAVQVDGDVCSACGLCARFCPTGALYMDSTADRFALNFRPDLCIDCGVCAVACPEQAVSFGEHLPVAAVTRGDHLSLAGGTMTTCVSCSAPTAKRPQEHRSLCYSCRQGAGTVSSLADNAGLMADLLKRLPSVGGQEQSGF